MHYISLICILVFHVLFFAKSIELSLTLKQSIRTINKTVAFSILWVMITIGLFCYTLWDFRNFEDITILQYGWIGLMVTACIIWWIALHTMKDSRRIGIPKHDPTKLITHGIYSYSRNPFFLAYDILIIGIVFFSWSGLVFISSIITILLFHKLILDEEQYLQSIHREEYTIYKKQTRRYI